MNLPRAVVELALGRTLTPLTDYDVGKLFVRISIDQIARLEDFQNVVVHGELSRQPASGASL
jgi:carbamoyl-phosphate synthase large subunit